MCTYNYIYGNILRRWWYTGCHAGDLSAPDSGTHAARAPVHAAGVPSFFFFFCDPLVDDKFLPGKRSA